MKRLWICLAFLAIFGNLAYAYDSEEQIYDEYDWDDGLEELDEVYNNNSLEDSDLPDDEISKTTTSDNTYVQDYQFEDNRSELNEEDSLNIADDNSDSDTEKKGIEKDIAYLTSSELENEGISINSLDNHKNNLLLQTKKTYTDLNFEKNIFEDTNVILNEESGNDFSQDDNTNLDKKNTTYLNKIFEETSRLLNETNDRFEEEIKIDEEKNNQETSKEDTVQAAYADLMAELNKLHETWGKLNDFGEYTGGDKDDSSSEGIFTKTITADDKNEDKEEKLNSSNEEHDSLLKKETTIPILYVNDALPARETETMDIPGKKTIIVSTEPTSTGQELALTDALVNMQTVIENVLLSEPYTTNTAAVRVTNEDTAFKESLEFKNDITRLVKGTQTTPELDSLISAETDERMKRFITEYKIAQITESDIRSAKNIWLTIDNPRVVTSPYYPNPYPNNSITDWMFTGDGMGIELNITDLALDGNVGDYLLFKPGGVDESGSTGLIFSYTLNKERRYRFLDVDKMFVRFVSKAGEDMRGFKFSVKMVVPRPGTLQLEPEPEQVIPEPSETVTLNLGGVSLEGFMHIEEKFRQIIADMAELYIKNNDINPGINTTLEITQITSRGLCFHNWPKFELCAEVSFGVPLVYDDDEERKPRLNTADLRQMWETYSQVDTFADRLKSLGIMEFQVPNDRGILTVWLVIAGGVVISMAMLAFALWRYSCFEDYTRMPKFSDTESIKEKRNLDLFPTPHQTLPPLYSETDYKWADAKCEDFTKVDVGGYTNKSYLRDDLYDLDSEEDIAPASAKNTSFSPRDIYSV